MDNKKPIYRFFVKPDGADGKLKKIGAAWLAPLEKSKAHLTATIDIQGLSSGTEYNVVLLRTYSDVEHEANKALVKLFLPTYHGSEERPVKKPKPRHAMSYRRDYVSANGKKSQDFTDCGKLWFNVDTGHYSGLLLIPELRKDQTTLFLTVRSDSN